MCLGKSVMSITLYETYFCNLRFCFHKTLNCKNKRNESKTVITVFAASILTEFSTRVVSNQIRFGNQF